MADRSLFHDRETYAAELRKRCGSAQVFRQVWAMVEPLFEATQQAKRLAPIIDAAVQHGLVTVVPDESVREQRNFFVRFWSAFIPLLLIVLGIELLR
jgi:hypothetical protein